MELSSPELSVVIATFNRATMLRACLEALARQESDPGSFEVIVVVDGSTDQTEQLVTQFAAPFSLRCLVQKNEGQAAALNRGIEAASAPFLLFLDDDMIAEPRLVDTHLAVQRGAGVIGLGRIVLELPPRAGRFARFRAEAYNARYAALDRGMRTPSWRDCSSGNLSVPRTAVVAAGGFATDLPRGYDNELGRRLEERGFSYAYVREASARQDYRKGFRQIAADTTAAGRASVEIYRRHPDLLAQLEIGGRGELGGLAPRVRQVLVAFRWPASFLAVLALAGADKWRASVYRFLFSYCYWKGVRAAVDQDTWRRFTRSTTILMYHAIGAPKEAASTYIVPRRRFELQMAWLRRSGHCAISLSEYLRYRAEHRFPPPKSIVITFDDGYADNKSEAHPILRSHSFPATIFLVTSATRVNEWVEGALAGRALMTWDEIRVLLRDGLEFGAHTRSHADLRSLSVAEAEREISDSLRELRRQLDSRPVTFAYPYGRHNEVVRGLVERAGFVAACGIESGVNSPATDAFRLRRLSVRGTDSLPRFAFNLWRGYRKYPR